MRLTDKKPEWRDKFCKHCDDRGINPDYTPRKSKIKDHVQVFTEPYNKKYHALTCPVCTA